jgi:3-oxoacyl-[acyl-carrier protein] reductase
MVIDLKGKTALVTGATGELGRVMARTLAGCGAKLIIHYHQNKTKADELVSEIGGKGPGVIAVQADVTDQDSVVCMRDLLADGFGLPDIIVNNAVVQYDWKPVLEQDIADYESQFRSCVLQNVLMAKAFAPHMIEAGWGRIIAINTECTMQASPNQSAYISGKAGQDRVIRVLAKEIGGEGVTVNQVAPGWTLSENVHDGKEADTYRGAVPLKRRGKDQEIANVVAFLASELASFITGAYIPVCGGNVMPTI